MKTSGKIILTSVWVYTAPKSWSKCTTIVANLAPYKTIIQKNMNKRCDVLNSLLDLEIASSTSGTDFGRVRIIFVPDMMSCRQTSEAV